MKKKNNYDIYILLLSDGLIKIGRSSQLKQRLLSHSHTAKLRNASISKIWNRCVYDPVKEEGALRAFCKERCIGFIGSEWFNGIDFDALVEFASTIQESSNEQINAHRNLKKYIDNSAEESILISYCDMVAAQRESVFKLYECAALIEQTLLDDAMGGAMFDPSITANNKSLFYLNAVLAIGTADSAWMRQLIHNAVNNPFEAVKLVFEGAKRFKK